MARHRRRHPQTPSYFTPPARQVFKGKRDDYSIANGDNYSFEFTPYSPPLSLPDQPAIWSDLMEVEDRRRYQPGRPAGFRAAASTRSAVAPTKTHANLTQSVVQTFKAPAHVAICVRRKIRKAVLHALKKTGRGSSPPRRRNYYSGVRC